MNEIEAMMDRIEQEAAGLNMDLNLQLSRVDAMKDAVLNKVDALKNGETKVRISPNESKEHGA